jgi:hypothetical protein
VGVVDETQGYYVLQKVVVSGSVILRIHRSSNLLERKTWILTSCNQGKTWNAGTGRREDTYVGMVIRFDTTSRDQTKIMGGKMAKSFGLRVVIIICRG